MVGSAIGIVSANEVHQVDESQNELRDVSSKCRIDVRSDNDQEYEGDCERANCRVLKAVAFTDANIFRLVDVAHSEYADKAQIFIQPEFLKEKV